MIKTLFFVLPLMLSPGPANLVSFALGVRFGLHRLFFFLLGIATVYLLVANILGTATVQVTSHFSSLGLPLQICGGLFIVYLGIKFIRRTPHTETAIGSPTFLKGVLLQVLNPKYPVVVLSVFAHNPSQPVLLTSIIITGVGIIGLIVYALAGTFINRKINAKKWVQALDAVFGIMLCLVGLILLAGPLM